MLTMLNRAQVSINQTKLSKIFHFHRNCLQKPSHRTPIATINVPKYIYFTLKYNLAKHNQIGNSSPELDSHHNKSIILSLSVMIERSISGHRKSPSLIIIIEPRTLAHLF